MRPLKFRAWDKEDKKMKDDFAICSFGTVFELNEGTFNDGRMYESGYIIMQFTGLKDKNNKEIYEGDILRYKNPAFYISSKTGKRCDDGGNRYKIVEWDNAGFNISNLQTSKWEVIGNIYEHNHLLNETA
ncbi:YopX family protein [Patescibacteria group bacterium]|nr:YopX family protein [Patescibacteria group bacterium]